MAATSFSLLLTLSRTKNYPSFTYTIQKPGPSHVSVVRSLFKPPRRRATLPKLMISSDKKDDKENKNENAGDLLEAEQEAVRCHNKRHKMCEEARQFINTMAFVVGKSESDEIESDNESLETIDSFIVKDDVCN